MINNLHVIYLALKLTSVYYTPSLSTKSLACPITFPSDLHT